MKDIFRTVTAAIVADLEDGVRPWHRPWQAGHSAGSVSRPLRVNGIPYRGINVVALWLAAAANGFVAPIWLTYRQAQELHAQVRRGERGSTIIYASTGTRTGGDSESDEGKESAVPFIRGYTVFNVDQIDGLPAHFYGTPAARLSESDRNASAEIFFMATGANIRHSGNEASYSIDDDLIRMPEFGSFISPEAYYAVLGHETVHWTRHRSRLDRELGRKRWGDEGYAMEELVAELGAAFLCADLQLTPQPRPEHSAYLASWLAALKHDPRAIITAASHAEKAVEFLNRPMRPTSNQQGHQEEFTAPVGGREGVTTAPNLPS